MQKSAAYPRDLVHPILQYSNLLYFWQFDITSYLKQLLQILILHIFSLLYFVEHPNP